MPFWSSGILRIRQIHVSTVMGFLIGTGGSKEPERELAIQTMEGCQASRSPFLRLHHLIYKHGPTPPPQIIFATLSDGSSSKLSSRRMACSISSPVTSRGPGLEK
jgi:hypothetical protein